MCLVGTRPQLPVPAQAQVHTCTHAHTHSEKAVSLHSALRIPPDLSLPTASAVAGWGPGLQSAGPGAEGGIERACGHQGYQGPPGLRPGSTAEDGAPHTGQCLTFGWGPCLGRSGDGAAGGGRAEAGNGSEVAWAPGGNPSILRKKERRLRSAGHLPPATAVSVGFVWDVFAACFPCRAEGLKQGLSH